MERKAVITKQTFDPITGIIFERWGKYNSQGEIVDEHWRLQNSAKKLHVSEMLEKKSGMYKKIGLPDIKDLPEFSIVIKRERLCGKYTVECREFIPGDGSEKVVFWVVKGINQVFSTEREIKSVLMRLIRDDEEQKRKLHDSYSQRESDKHYSPESRALFEFDL